MSILQIYDQTAPLVSGYSMRSRYISESLVKLGMKLRVVSSPIFQYETPEEKINGVTYIRTTVKGWSMIRKVPIVREGVIVQSLKNKINNNWCRDIRVIDAHSSVLNGMVAYSVAERQKIPFIYEIRALWEDAAVDQGKTKEGSFRYNLTRKLETDVIQKAEIVTVICEGLKHDIISRGVNPEKIFVISNGVEIDKFSPLEADEEIIERYNLKDTKVFGFVGTFFEFEGLDLLLRSAKLLLSKRNDVRFLIVGGGRQEELLKQLSRELGISDKVIFTGRVDHDEIKKYYSVIDVLLYPRISKRITELVTPLKPLEAMAMEKIVIGSDVGGIKELVKDGYNGLLFERENVEQLADKCIYVLDHFSQMKVIAKQAREYVIKERDWTVICRRYLEIFEKLGVLG